MSQFMRVGLGFWGSAWDWCREIALCRFGVHELDPSGEYCLRCGTAGLGQP